MPDVPCSHGDDDIARARLRAHEVDDPAEIPNVNRIPAQTADLLDSDNRLHNRFS